MYINNNYAASTIKYITRHTTMNPDTPATAAVRSKVQHSRKNLEDIRQNMITIKGAFTYDVSIGGGVGQMLTLVIFSYGKIRKYADEGGRGSKNDKSADVICECSLKKTIVSIN